MPRNPSSPTVRWKGIAIGGLLGGIVGRGLLGVLLGAAIGRQIELRIELGRRRKSEWRHGDSSPDGARDPLAGDYAVLGARPSDSAQELTRKYRALAKRHHPDALRAGGRSDEAIRAATDRMSRINAAWSRIRSARGI